MAVRGATLNLDSYIQYTIPLDNLVREGQQDPEAVREVQPSRQRGFKGEPMEVDWAQISEGECRRSLRGRLCLYCGEPGHICAACPKLLNSAKPNEHSLTQEPRATSSVEKPPRDSKYP